MTCRSKQLIPADFTCIVNGRAFEQWKRTLRDAASCSVIPVVSDLMTGDFEKGHLTDAAVDRMMAVVKKRVKEVFPRVRVEFNFDMIKDYIKSY